jgi:hypothetical protein
MSTAGNERGSAPIFCDCGQRGVRSQMVMQHRIAWVIAYDIWNCTHCIVFSCFSVCITVAFSPFTFSKSLQVLSQGSDILVGICKSAQETLVR